MKTIRSFQNPDEVDVWFGSFPLTPALSLGEREHRSPRFEKSEATGGLSASKADKTKRGDEATGAIVFKDRADALPLPEGEGRGEGEEPGQISTSLLAP